MSRAPVLMIQGTTSSAGKSMLVTGLCRLFANEGISVAPFKAQNMSNNAFVTAEGFEIGRAQAVQAMAARIRPTVEMNPVLLKPEADHRSQVILMGKPAGTMDSSHYHDRKALAWGYVTSALDKLRAEYDLVIIEGAGSPAEINLKSRDISNMSVATHAQSPVLIVGDIDRGGVFAHFYGTYWLLDPAERALVKGFVINKFRGDATLLAPAPADIERLTEGVPVLGIVPWVHDHRIPEEDAVAVERRAERSSDFAGVDIAVIRLPRIANFDDFDALEAEADVRVRYVDSVEGLEGADLVIIPGTKSTAADLEWLRATGLAAAIADGASTGLPVLGICGGFQMLGTRIDDPGGIESSFASVPGLGLVPAVTTFTSDKDTRQCRAHFANSRGLFGGLDGCDIEGYEIHAGRTELGSSPALVRHDGGPVGAADASGWVAGIYVHGALTCDPFRRRLLANVAVRRDKRYAPSPIEGHEAAFDRLAAVLSESLDMPRIRDLARPS